jgi:hypothetical protein
VATIEEEFTNLPNIALAFLSFGMILLIGGYFEYLIGSSILAEITMVIGGILEFFGFFLAYIVYNKSVRDSRSDNK